MQCCLVRRNYYMALQNVNYMGIVHPQASCCAFHNLCCRMIAGCPGAMNHKAGMLGNKSPFSAQKGDSGNGLNSSGIIQGKI